MRPALLFEVIDLQPDGRLLVAMFGARAPTDATWSKYLHVIAGLGPQVRVLAFSNGGGPTLRQRRQLETVLGDRGGRAAIITRSRIAREIVAAIRWFDRDIQAFAPNEWRRVQAFMGLDALAAARVARALRGMARRMSTLDEFELR